MTAATRMALERYVNRRIAAYNSRVADPAVRIIAELEVSSHQTRYTIPLHAARAGFAVAVRPETTLVYGEPKCEGDGRHSA